MIDLTRLTPLLTDLEKIYIEYERQKAYVRTKDEELGVDSFTMISGDQLYYVFSFGRDEVVKIRGTNGSFKVEEHNELLYTPEMELILYNYTENIIKLYEKAIDVTIDKRESRIRDVYLKVIDRCEFKDERNNTNFCYIK